MLTNQHFQWVKPLLLEEGKELTEDTKVEVDLLLSYAGEGSLLKQVIANMGEDESNEIYIKA